MLTLIRVDTLRRVNNVRFLVERLICYKLKEGNGGKVRCIDEYFNSFCFTVNIPEHTMSVTTINY